MSHSVLAAVLTCVSNGRDVSSEGQPYEGNSHYQNRGLLVSQQEVWAAGGRIVPGPSFWVVWRLSAASSRDTAAADLMGSTDGDLLCVETPGL